MALVKYNNNSISTITTPGQLSTGKLVPIKTLTASSSSTISFVHGSSDVVLDNTYFVYLFIYTQIHPASSGVRFEFNMSTDSGSNYNVPKTSTFFEARHNEGASAQGFGEETSDDLANGTGFQSLVRNFGNDNDQCASGFLYLFSPYSTTHVKQYMVQSSGFHESDYNLHNFCHGYGNTTSAVNGVRFQMNSGAIDSGKIKLYGIKDS